MIEAYGSIFNKETTSRQGKYRQHSRLPNVDAAEDFYQEALEELDRKPYPSLKEPESLSNTSPNKIPRPRPSRSMILSTAVGLRSWIARGSLRKCMGRSFRSGAGCQYELVAGLNRTITCAICRAQFHELGGASCRQCRRIVCRRHFFRGFFKGRGALCSECLKKNSLANKKPKESSN